MSDTLPQTIFGMPVVEREFADKLPDGQVPITFGTFADFNRPTVDLTKPPKIEFIRTLLGIEGAYYAFDRRFPTLLAAGKTPFHAANKLMPMLLERMTR